MWELYKCNLKRLVRSPIPLATILALFLFVNALGVSSLHQYGEPLAMLQNDIPSNLILFLGFLFLSFFCVQTAGRQVGESLGQGNGVRARQECCQLAVMVSVCLFVSCNYFLYPLIAYAKMGVSSSLLLLHLLKVTVLDFFLVGLLGISAGSAIGIWLSPTAGTVTLLGTAILFSPAPQMVLSSFHLPISISPRFWTCFTSSCEPQSCALTSLPTAFPTRRSAGIASGFPSHFFSSFGPCARCLQAGGRERRQLPCWRC